MESRRNEKRGSVETPSALRLAYLALKKAEHEAEWWGSADVEQAWRDFEEEVKRLRDSPSEA